MKLERLIFFTTFAVLALLPVSIVYAHVGYGGHGGWHGSPHGFMSSAWSTHVTSSGTSDCVGGSPLCGPGYGLENMKPIYLREKAEQIAEEAAQGEGSHLEVLARLMGCSDEKT